MSSLRLRTSYLAAGVHGDFERLLTVFTETQSVRYELFAELWNTTHMASIFAGRPNKYEMREVQSINLVTDF